MKQPLKKSFSCWPQRQVGRWTKCRGLGWVRWLLPDFIITCISRNLNELRGPDFLSQRVQVLGRVFSLRCFRYTPFGTAMGGKTHLKFLSCVFWYSLLSAAEPEGHLPCLHTGRFSESTSDPHETLSFLCQFVSVFESPNSVGRNNQSPVTNLGTNSYWEQQKRCLRSFWKPYLISVYNCSWSNTFKNTTSVSGQHSAELRLNTCKTRSTSLTEKHYS